MFPSLFNLCIKEATNKVGEEIAVDGERINVSRFADDIAIITDKDEGLQNILRIMNLTLINECTMQINKAKTKVLVCSHNEENPIILNASELQ